KIHVRPRVTIHDQEWIVPQQGKRVEDPASRLERRGALIAVDDVHAVADAVAERGPDPVAEPGKIDDDVMDPGLRQRFEVIADEGFAGDLQQRLRPRARQGPHALAAPRGQEHGLHAICAATRALATGSSGATRRSRNPASSASSGYLAHVSRVY